jgi:putative DNA methylase
MIEPQPGFALIALTRTGRGGDAGCQRRSHRCLAEGTASVLLNFPVGARGGVAWQADASSPNWESTPRVLCTDPPYYDNVPYADLSDYFHVWLRRSLKPLLPDVFSTLVIPKAEELVAAAYRHGSKQKAETFFYERMTDAMMHLAEHAHPAFPATIYYAFKQSETKSDEVTASTG